MPDETKCPDCGLFTAHHADGLLVEQVCWRRGNEHCLLQRIANAERARDAERVGAENAARERDEVMGWWRRALAEGRAAVEAEQKAHATADGALRTCIADLNAARDALAAERLARADADAFAASETAHANRHWRARMAAEAALRAWLPAGRATVEAVERELAEVRSVLAPWMHEADTLASRARRLVEKWKDAEGALLLAACAGTKAERERDVAHGVIAASGRYMPATLSEVEAWLGTIPAGRILLDKWGRVDALQDKLARIDGYFQAIANNVLAAAPFTDEEKQAIGAMNAVAELLDWVPRVAVESMAKENAELLRRLRHEETFVGPCAHGADPYTRCDEGCDLGTSERAAIIAWSAMEHERDAAVGLVRNLLARAFRDGGQRAATFTTLADAVAAAEVVIAEVVVGRDALARVGQDALALDEELASTRSNW